MKVKGRKLVEILSIEVKGMPGELKNFSIENRFSVLVPCKDALQW